MYIVERYLPGVSRDELERILRRVERASLVQVDGESVRYFGSTIVLGDESCFCLFEAASEEAVAGLNRRARAPFDRIVPAIAVSPVAADK
jgi:uncharacterized protein DUF4242